MATVTGMTAAAMQAIRDGTIVSAAFDSANHLILTKYDGTQVDGGTLGLATTAAPGQVELATNAETQSGSDATKAVTPAGLASLPGYRVQLLAANQIAESATPAAWPYGVSIQNCTTSSGWSLMSGFGTVTTYSFQTDRTYQTFTSSNGGSSPVQQWTRTYHTTTGGGGWTAWTQNGLMVNLAAASFTQTTALANYPLGWSRIYYTSANSTGWDFNGYSGEVLTFRDGTDFARQVWTRHANASSTDPGMVWFRTSNAANGWSPWMKTVTDPGAWISYTPTWTSQGSAQPALGNATTRCKYQKIGRTVNVYFYISFGSTTNFGTGVTGSDNWQFSLPVPAANSTDDGLGFLEMYQSATNNGLARVKLYSTTGFRMGVSSGSVGTTGTAGGIGGDVDSITPFNWASGNFLRGSFTYESAS